MRLALAAAACAAMLALAGCGQGSDNEMRAGIRERSIASCVAGFQRSSHAAGFDAQRLCECTVDRYMAGRNTADLDNPPPHDPALRAAGQQCMMEQIGGTTAAPEPSPPDNAATPAG